jgi:hypothetical protein
MKEERVESFIFFEDGEGEETRGRGEKHRRKEGGKEGRREEGEGRDWRVGRKKPQ